MYVAMLYFTAYNPCEKDNGYCLHKCIHDGINREYRCECEDGWVLAKDKKTCIGGYLMMSDICSSVLATQ